MNYNQYNLTFDEIYDWFYERVDSGETVLADFFTTLFRFKEQPEYRRALRDAVNDFWETSDGIASYLVNAPIRKPDKVLEILVEGKREKWSDVCAAFGVSTCCDAANDLRNALETIFKRGVRTRSTGKKAAKC